MKLTFFGAAKAVTGSCHCLEVGGKKILIDCGLQQGRDERDNRVLDFAPGYIDYVIVTHAHIDHSGRIPLLVKQGFHGKIVTTRLTGQLMSIMLRDSAHIQESDAQWQNQKGKRAGRAPVEPLYTIADAEAALELVTTCEYGELVDLCEGVRLRFVDAGHLLGSACVELWLTEDGVTKKIVFSGDLGNRDQPIIRDPQYIDEADYVVMESTYGDRLHEVPESYTEALAAIIDETFARGGNVIIPSFAVGRTQELLYYIKRFLVNGTVPGLEKVPVYIDSPLGIKATRIYAGCGADCYDDETKVLARSGDLFEFDSLHIAETVEQSMEINDLEGCNIIISASGMCEAGRIRHHLKNNLYKANATVVFVGYQAVGTLGRIIIDGAKKVKILGVQVIINAAIKQIEGFSGHADQSELLEWVS